MDTPELEEIVATVEAAIRKAYAQGRTDALKNVVKMLQDDKSGVKPLALAAPGGAQPAAEQKPIRISSYTGLPLKDSATNGTYMKGAIGSGSVLDTVRDYFTIR